MATEESSKSSRSESNTTSATTTNSSKNDNADMEKVKKHDSGAADLEKVTDYAEEKEIASSATADLEDAIATIRSRQAARNAERLARERELAKVSIRREDVELIAEQMELSANKAERTLREHGGNVVDALAAIVNS